MVLLKISKMMASLLSSALVLGAVAGTPLAVEAKSKQQHDDEHHIDWSVINEEALVAHLKKQGEIDEDASQKQIQQAIRKYVLNGSVPGSHLDEEDGLSKFAKEAKKSQAGFQKYAADLVSGKAKSSKKKSRAYKDVHTDNAVVALIEFPDFKHNRLPKPENDEYLWTADFSPKHYDKLLFNNNGYKTPEGIELTTLTQFYQEQSAGSWQVDGTVTNWITAKNEAKYYGGHKGSSKDANPRALVAETLETIGKQIAGEEWKYDQRDPYDIDEDHNVMEPDGMLDNLFVVHSGVGEDSGGGELGEDAIWAHRWTLSRPTTIPGTSLKAYDYIIQGEEGSAGVFGHEYGHNLGLPDEYDTDGSGNGEPIGVWSVMSAGSWAGKIPGTEPTGFSPWAKLWLKEVYGGTWPTATEISFDDLKKGRSYQHELKEAVADTSTGKILKINLPDRDLEAPTQPKGKFSYFSAKGDNLDTKLTSPEIDLTGAAKATLSFDSWRQIEEGYDYLYVNIYAGGDKPEVVKQYDDDTKDLWVSEEIDLSKFAGKKIKVEFNYVTDGGLAMEAFYVDNIKVKADDKVVFEDDAEGEAKFELNGFMKFDGSPSKHPNYYLIEWRTHNGVDAALAKWKRGNSLVSYDPGLVVWYYDGRYDIGGAADNMSGLHPGEGFLSVVDAHQRGHFWSDGKIADSRYQMVDAAFNFKKVKTSPIEILRNGLTMSYPGLPGIDKFSDQNDYSAEDYSPKGGGIILPVLGLTIQVKSVNKTGDEVTFSIAAERVKSSKSKKKN